MISVNQPLRTQVVQWLQQQVPASRLSHILRVEEMATQLALQHGLDAARAAQAGIMHDLAKNFKPQQLLDLARSHDLLIDPVMAHNPHLLHAEVSAIVAQQEFGVTDQEILGAIAHHTLGFPGMSPLSCVVFLADSLEPGRGDTDELNHLRQVSTENLFTAVWMNCDYTLHYLLEHRHVIHPRVIDTRNWFLGLRD